LRVRPPREKAALGIDQLLASQLNMLIPVGVIVGAPLFGWMPDRFGLDKCRVLIGILVTYVVSWVGITFFTNFAGVGGTALVLLVMGGAGGAFISTLWGIIRLVVPPAHLGLFSGILNPAPFLGVAAFQVLTGAILDRSAAGAAIYSLTGFHNAFIICLACATVCLAVSFLIRTPDQDDPEAVTVNP
jgi:MFS family permease